jgi:uncharacterized protein YukE
MTILYMDVESVQNTRSKLATTQQTMREEIAMLTISIQRIIGSAWIGPSASGLYDEYDQIRIQLMQNLDTLDQLSKTLQNEIGQWQEVAARFG